MNGRGHRWAHLPPRPKKRTDQPSEVDGAVGQIVIQRRNGDVYRVLLDADDLPVMRQFTWGVDLGMGKRTPYACTTLTVAGQVRRYSMHRLILNPPPELHVDHLDGDGLNNLRSNLRAATVTQNRANELAPRESSSRYKGVSMVTAPEGGWTAWCNVRGKLTYLGTFDREIDAALTYDDAARAEFGEYAATNFDLEFAATFERWPRRRRKPRRHGTGGYAAGCGCNVCRDAYLAYQRNYDRTRRGRTPRVAS